MRSDLSGAKRSFTLNVFLKNFWLPWRFESTQPYGTDKTPVCHGRNAESGLLLRQLKKLIHQSPEIVIDTAKVLGWEIVRYPGSVAGGKE
jgi:hypothetical protein